MSHNFYTRITAIIFLLTISISGQFLGYTELDEGISVYNGYFHVNQMSLISEIYILFSGLIILLSWPATPPINVKKINNLKNVNLKKKMINVINFYQNALDKSKDYCLIILFNVFGAILLVSSFNLISLYISIELQSFALYILATLNKESRIVTAAGLKYFILGALSTCFILLGFAFIYAFTGVTSLDSIYVLFSSLIFDSSVNLSQFNIGIILIFIGFLFKIGAAPLHNWSPDVYGDSPTIVTVWLTVIPKLSILILLLELYLQLDPKFSILPSIDFLCDYSSVKGIIAEYLERWGGRENYEAFVLANPKNIPFEDLEVVAKSFITSSRISDVAYAYNNAPNDVFWNFFFNEQTLIDINNNTLNNLLFISSLLSLIIGTVLGLAQSQIKRLLAYSTISHLGFILLALSINTEESLDSFLFYILQYTLTNLNVFLIILAFNYLLSTLFKNKLVIEDIKYISELTNQFDKNPILTISFIICLLSMAGIPPFIGFYSKLFVLFSAISTYEYFISIIAILVSVISAYYYLRIIKVLYTEDTKIANTTYEYINPINENKLNFESNTILTNIHSLIIAVLSLFLLLFFLNPTLILTSTRVLSLSLFNF